MMLRYLCDENVNIALVSALRRHESGLEVWRVGAPAAPPLGVLDPAILDWCESQNIVLITNNRHSMPTHLTDHLAAGRQMPGIFLLSPGWGIGEIVDMLVLAASASRPGEHRDQIKHISGL